MPKLSKAQRERARARAAQAALLGHRNRGNISYTQGSRRWVGINNKRNSAKGQYPGSADCSAYTTWCLWNALKLLYNEPDQVNGTNWQYGFTGTQIRHGRKIEPRDLMRADLIFYATRGSTPTHVAICVGRKDNKPMVISHGSESGPLYLPWNYRRIIQVRRYIHGDT